MLRKIIINPGMPSCYANIGFESRLRSRAALGGLVGCLYLFSFHSGSLCRQELLLV